MVSPQEADEHLQKFRTWLTDDGWGVQAVNDPENHQNLQFSKEGSPTYNLIHPNPNANFAAIAVGIPGDEFTAVLKKQDQPEVQDFLWDLRISLLELGVEFKGVDVPTENISIHAPTYFEGTTRDSFMDKFRSVKNAIHLLRWKLNATFSLQEETLGTQPDDQDYIH